MKNLLQYSDLCQDNGTEPKSKSSLVRIEYEYQMQRTIKYQVGLTIKYQVQITINYQVHLTIEQNRLYSCDLQEYQMQLATKPRTAQDERTCRTQLCFFDPRLAKHNRYKLQSIFDPRRNHAFSSGLIFKVDSLALSYECYIFPLS